ncbi:pseudouridine synthase [Durotheca rogersii]|uniref:pseudouridine synthase n=1 Tax=Durotheca rogersii TaxID=419775 RepID=UPI00221F81D1|nr:pseudouridine synthase [Durotheca rogersii]KAI5863288.1 pseudouridine synthase [Durotheca rogersii]
MVAEDGVRGEPNGNVPSTSEPKGNLSKNPSDAPAIAEPTADAGEGRGRHDGRNKQHRRLDANGRRKGRDTKRKDSHRGGDHRDPSDKRPRTYEWQERKRRRLDEDKNSGRQPEPSYMSIQFPEEEIAAEERRPKRKVAVLIGYAGTGYHGLQINHREKTIEGDLFAALVAAKAISKANADDPRKSSFVRCARTDKGVHAAGNMISLKLIVEDSGLVKRINDELPPQIRVWGIQRTNNAFSCYQSCDSRWYEYLMPSYCLLPPHPESYLGKKVLESVKEKGVEDEYAKRLSDVKDYWEEVEKNEIRPILDALDPDIRETVMRRMHVADFVTGNTTFNTGETSKPEADLEPGPLDGEPTDKPTETEEEIPDTKPEGNPTDASDGEPASTGEDSAATAGQIPEPTDAAISRPIETPDVEPTKPRELHPVERALRQIKATYVAAKRRYRVTPERLSQLQDALDRYTGTKNFHNYTIQKAHGDPSARRTIKSFVASREPIQINDTEWLSLKVHGQSFMMHQIRKMVGMAVLVTRCATPLARVDESYSAARISIPKAPSLGLLLERPVFENYNRRAREQYNLAELDFAAHEAEIQAFKDAHIYRRIFELEEKENSFHTFFHQIDHYKSAYFLWVTAGGLDAAQTRAGPMEAVPEGLEDNESGDEEQDPAGNEG